MHKKRHKKSYLIPGALASLAAGAAASVGAQELSLPDVSVGAGMRTSFVHTSNQGADDGNDFLVDSMRLYVNGGAANQIEFTFNTEYNASTSDVRVIDAIARLEFSDTFNIWMGRFLPPSDRSNLYGPYYANHWGVYTDGVQDGYPFVEAGRADGIAYWGQFDSLKLSLGAFDVPRTTGSNDVVIAARAQLSLWDREPGYYLNGTYYGDKDVLSIGFAGQFVNGDQALTADILVEKGLDNTAVVSFEAQASRYDGLGGYDAAYGLSTGWYGLLAYLFPGDFGAGRLQLAGKYAQADFEKGLSAFNLDYTQRTSEVNVNYILSGFNARFSLFFRNTEFSAVRPDFSVVGFGLQLQI